MQQNRGKVLIANRGEIAIRIARSAKALGFGTVAVYSDADRWSEHAKYCDEAYWIGPSEPQASYLNVEKLMEVAKQSGARYVHPGYGFLSERPHFVEAVQKAGLVFVGPSADNMRVMGDKIEARKTVDQLKVPRVPGSPGAVKTAVEAQKIAEGIEYPILLKAAAGGGGKGMRKVESSAEVAAAFESASREALSAFGDGALYVEKYIVEPHHVEIQVFGDGKGGAIHLGERECSIQRRHQKVWEESPAPILDRHPETRAQMFEAALRVTAGIRYAGAGTLEFIVDGKGRFYFLEMNTRLQVEHPVTEWVTGVDLVAWQLLLAEGKWELPAIPERRGSAVEVRIYAEDPQSFLPAPGTIGDVRTPSGPFVRWDSSFVVAGDVSRFYDPMISKLSVWAASRPEAIGRLRVALEEVRLEPPLNSEGVQQGSLKTNLSFLKRLAVHPTVLGGDTTTHLIADHGELTEGAAVVPSADAVVGVALVQTLFQMGQSEGAANPSAGNPSHWSRLAREEGLRG